MHFYHWLLSALLFVSASDCFTRAGESPAVSRASSEEPGARVLAFSRHGRTVVASRRERKGFATQLRDATTGRVRADPTSSGVGR
jgi:hypothetical protein